MWREHFIIQGLRIEQLIVYYSYDTVLVARMRVGSTWRHRCAIFDPMNNVISYIVLKYLLFMSIRVSEKKNLNVFR